MKWKSDAHRYGAMAVSIHWVTALAIFGLLASGLTLDNMANGPDKENLLRGHVLAGILVLLLTLLRIVWWLFADQRPALPADMPRWQTGVARFTHYLFYVLIAVMASSGIALIALSGAGEILFGGSSAALPDFRQFAPRAPHGAGAWALMGLIALHVGAALYHQFIRRDRLLGRMGIGSPPG